MKTPVAAIPVKRKPGRPRKADTIAQGNTALASPVMMESPPLVLTIRETATMLRMSRSTLDKLVRSGKGPRVIRPSGGMPMIALDDLKSWLRQLSDDAERERLATQQRAQAQAAQAAATEAAAATAAAQVRRPRGRPRKYPLPQQTAASTAA
ncbi:hypothetical protein Tamer19_16440 [Cupriavidus sp. TA19]|uniref:helix-turn-helix transcriptional regulator n=1 Tax=unclassified Cupriavidus TaxID=2640874 RepID=UPI00272940EE|nr:helix-turn-helix domain-containing protein [Cupriavidus sp. TA19]GLC92236.1 hypothetical protein Tamer19_16440 [Cupriavidus sp. TA19]